jgi:DNA-binding winged helix-turn-helix (wHTH) protein
MEKRIIPITIENDKLRLIISEIIESNNIYGNLEFQLTDRNDLNKNNESILITDNEFAVKELSHAVKFDTIFIINCNSDTIEMDKLNSNIVQLSIPLQIRDLYQRVSKSFDQINSQTARKLNFNRFTYDPSMRTLSNDNLYLRFTEKESQIFNSLLDESNTHISKKNLLKKVWSYNDDIDTHTLETHIYSLRKKIEKNLLIKDLIVFEENKGYFLNTKIL